MKRGKVKTTMFIVAGIVITGMILLNLLNGTFLTTSYNPVEDHYDSSVKNMTETQFHLIQEGLKASSSHNMQPWKIEIIDDMTFRLYADMDKQLEVVDKGDWQMLVSQGTFINRVKASAKHQGIDLKVEYNVMDMADDMPLIAELKIENIGYDNIDTLTSASIAMSEDVSDPLNIVKQYEQDTPFTLTYIQAESNGNGEDNSNENKNDNMYGDFSNLQNILLEGTQIESRNKKAIDELLEVFRFTKWEKNKYRYGLELNTVNPFILTMVGPMMNYTTSSESFGKSSISVFESRLEKEESYILIHKETMSNSDYIQLGELLSGITSDLSGYVARPEVQLLEDIEGMEEASESFQTSYGKPEVVFIIGIRPAEKGYYEVMRHKVQDIVY